MIVEKCPSTQQHGDGLAKNSHMFAGIFVKYQLYMSHQTWVSGWTIHRHVDLKMIDALVYP